MNLTILTFGYEVSEPPEDCVWVADVRNIPSSVITGMWQMDGTDKAIQDAVLATSEAKAWIRKFENRLSSFKDGDRIAIGCSIGVHRSVALAYEFARIARERGWDVTVRNLDLGSRRDTGSTITRMEGAATMAYEVRAAGSAGLTFTVDPSGKPRIDARAILFDSWSVDLGGFRERMRPNSVTLESDLVALFDHDTSKVLGRTSAGTMEVRTDSAGVAFSAYPPETTWAADLRVSMERGDIKGCSYRMMVDEDVWYVENGMVCRDVLKARVSELTITSMPAYPETTAEARDHAAALAKTAVPEKVEERAGRVLSTTNEYLVKAAVEALDGVNDGMDAIESAVELVKTTLVNVLQQVDPTYQPEGEGDMGGCDCEMPCTDPNCTCEDPNCPMCSGNEVSDPSMDGASTQDRGAAGGAPVKKAGTFVSGFGFITTKRK